MLDDSRRSHAPLDDVFQANDGNFSPDLRRSGHVTRDEATPASSSATRLNKKTAAFFSLTSNPRVAESSNDLLHALVSGRMRQGWRDRQIREGDV